MLRYPCSRPAAITREDYPRALDRIELAIGNVNLKNASLYRVDTVMLHPEFDSSLDVTNHDIALVKVGAVKRQSPIESKSWVNFMRTYLRFLLLSQGIFEATKDWDQV